MDNLLPVDGELFLYQGFYSRPEADSLFDKLYNSLDWQTERIFIFGQWQTVPRLMCWYGEKEACYSYSGIDHLPLPWTNELLAIRERLQTYCKVEFNSVLANLYRNGQDSMGCHADDEKELGINPTIASVSFGDTRRFKVHHKTKKQVLDIDLCHGDLLVMSGTIQKNWRHSLPKTRKHKYVRINLTYRNILII